MDCIRLGDDGLTVSRLRLEADELMFLDAPYQVRPVLGHV
jgi:hypothetical protein